MNPNILNFYGASKANGYLSNFYNQGFIFEGRYWKTAEHAFQAMKFTTSEEIDRIHTAPNPTQAKRLGSKSGGMKLREDWDTYRIDAMYQVLISKFYHNSDLAQLLIDSFPDILVEHTVRDKFWGDGGNGKGINMLGKLLMRVREKLIRDLENLDGQ